MSESEYLEEQGDGVGERRVGPAGGEGTGVEEGVGGRAL